MKPIPSLIAMWREQAKQFERKGLRIESDLVTLLADQLETVAPYAEQHASIETQIGQLDRLLQKQ